MEGLLPENLIDELSISTFIFHFVTGMCTLALIVFSMVEAIKVHNSMVLNQQACVFMSAVTVLAKVFAIVRNKSCFVSVIDDLKSHTFNAHDEQQNEHIQFVDRITKLILRYYVVVGVTFLLFSCLLPFILDVKMVIPPPFEVGKFEILYKFVHFTVISYMVLNSVTFDVLYMSIMGLCIAQLIILRERLISVAQGDNNTKAVKKYKDTYRDAEQVLKECVLLHEMLNK